METEPASVELRFQDSNTTVFRLRWTAGVPSSVVLKKSRRANSAVERTVYQAVLPCLSVRAPVLYDAVDDGEDAWLILEDAGELQPSLQDIDVIYRLSRCMAAAHQAASRLGTVSGLPDRGPDHFQRRLRSLLLQLTSRRESAAAPAERDVLDRAIEICHAVWAQWSRLEHACAPLPMTVVHGDITAENLRLGDGGELILLDWEKAGWGPAAVDLGLLDLAAYREATGTTWPRCSPGELERAAWAGRVFRVLVHNFASKPAPKIQRYAKRLATLLSESA